MHISMSSACSPASVPDAGGSGRRYSAIRDAIVPSVIAALRAHGRRHLADMFAALLGLESQVWLTGTDAALFAPLRSAARFLRTFFRRRRGFVYRAAPRAPASIPDPIDIGSR